LTLFTDVSSDRTVRALEKAGFKIIKQGKHIGMSDGERKDNQRRRPYE